MNVMIVKSGKQGAAPCLDDIFVAGCDEAGADLGDAAIASAHVGAICVYFCVANQQRAFRRRTGALRHG
ncbi:MAG: hypothetical protein OXT64_04255 [Gammaproteobacteria bacterium]|nr:hypothetical protein [Gammaproteobacteria bacterium]